MYHVVGEPAADAREGLLEEGHLAGRGVYHPRADGYHLTNMSMKTHKRKRYVCLFTRHTHK